MKKAEDYKTGKGGKEVADLKTKINDFRQEIKGIKNTADPKRSQREAQITNATKKLDKLLADQEKWTNFVGKGIDVDKVAVHIYASVESSLATGADSIGISAEPRIS